MTELLMLTLSWWRCQTLGQETDLNTNIDLRLPSCVFGHGIYILWRGCQSFHFPQMKYNEGLYYLTSIGVSGLIETNVVFYPAAGPRTCVTVRCLGDGCDGIFMLMTWTPRPQSHSHTNLIICQVKQLESTPMTRSENRSIIQFKSQIRSVGLILVGLIFL